MTRCTELLIRTPEGVTFALPLASLVHRSLAWGIDFFCTTAALVVVTQLIGFLSLISPDLGQALGVLAFFVINLGYGIVFEWWWRGSSPGKKALRLQVVDAAGLRLRFSQIVLRNLLRTVDMLPLFYLVGGIAALISRHSQRLGDLAAGTVVIRKSRVAQPDLDQLFADKFNSLRAHPHLVARLRQEISPAEAAVGLQAITRRDRFTVTARVALFGELAAHYRQATRLPEELLLDLTDEQLVRNVVDVLYRSDPVRRPAPPVTV